MPPHLPIPYIFPYTTLFRSDQLSQSGVRFQNHYVCTPASSPSCATLFTGRVPRQHGIQDFLTGEPIENPPQGQAAPPASFKNETMLSDLLAAAGYECGYAGKWHMGDNQQPRPEERR